MKHWGPLLLGAAGLLALAGCRQDTPEEQPQEGQAAQAGREAPSTTPAPAASASPSASETAFSDGASSDTALPAAMQGRWGLVAEDCEPGRADGKGLLIISPRRLEFYESVASLSRISDATPNRVRASFAFTGEGMSWQRDMTIEVADDGRTLVRREFGEDAATEPLRYSKC